jgi:hypothetical protein
MNELLSPSKRDGFFYEACTFYEHLTSLSLMLFLLTFYFTSCMNSLDPRVKAVSMD